MPSFSRLPDAAGGVRSPTGAGSLPQLEVLFPSVVLEHALVDCQEPAIGATDHGVRFLVADEPYVGPSDVPDRLTRLTRDLMLDIGLVENPRRNPSVGYDAIERSPRDRVAGNQGALSNVPLFGQ